MNSCRRRPSGGPRRAAARLGRALSPRGALALQSVDGALSFALRAALAMALPALPMALAGRADQAVYAMLGSFTTTFGRNLPYARRARVLAVVAVAMTACVGCGAALAAWAHPRDGGAGAAVTVAATALVAGLAKFACDAARLSGLGAVLLLFSFAVAANGASSPADVLPRAGLAACGAAVAWTLAVAGFLVHPDRPQRLAVAAALRELADLWETGGRTGPVRHRATAAVLQAYRTLGVLPPSGAERRGRDDTCVRLADLSWSLLVGSARHPRNEPAGLARALRDQAGLLTGRRRRPPRILPDPALSVLTARAGMPAPGPGPARAPGPDSDPGSGPDSDPAPGSGPGPEPRPAPAPAGPTTLRAAELRAAALVTGAAHGRGAVLLVPALRMVLGTGLAGGAALLLGLGHGYWAAISAAAVLHSVNVRTAAQRAVQRTLGTVAGLLLALGVLALGPGPVALVLVIVLLEFLLEYVVARNYGLGVVFLTPLALLLTDLAAPAPAGDLVRDRALSSVLGVGVALGCALIVVHDRAAVRAERALAACTAASERAERALGEGAVRSFPLVQTRLAAAAVELREADDAAAGELWQAEIDPTELAAAERRAYLLLDRLARWG
ncbi:putative membrane protein YccC [Streptomyces sp. PanSC19]|uniref:FUSC family protein n=1 Tax=Streptomyces sp. PanSC19 TaxID=1520455 RepID=UPI000F478128|nr:FUSC family protein [Streptomyces sp. PanSC19]ROQ35516.1 putative membrane protein YccC [Streptomyces sp. PanSC19]